MSFASYKMMHLPTGVEHCASGFISHSAADFTSQIHPVSADDLDSEWLTSTKPAGPIPNLITAAANVLEIYTVRLQEDSSSPVDSKNLAEPKRGGVLAGISGASLELVCDYRFFKIYVFMLFLRSFSPTWLIWGLVSCSSSTSILYWYQTLKWWSERGTLINGQATSIISTELELELMALSWKFYLGNVFAFT